MLNTGCRNRAALLWLLCHVLVPIPGYGEKSWFSCQKSSVGNQLLPVAPAVSTHAGNGVSRDAEPGGTALKDSVKLCHCLFVFYSSADGADSSPSAAAWHISPPLCSTARAKASASSRSA